MSMFENLDMDEQTMYTGSEPALYNPSHSDFTKNSGSEPILYGKSREAQLYNSDALARLANSFPQSEAMTDPCFDDYR